MLKWISGRLKQPYIWYSKRNIMSGWTKGNSYLAGKTNLISGRLNETSCLTNKMIPYIWQDKRGILPLLPLF